VSAEARHGPGGRTEHKMSRAVVLYLHEFSYCLAVVVFCRYDAKEGFRSETRDTVLLTKRKQPFASDVLPFHQPYHAPATHLLY
jgi:hypothetical protein